MTRVARRLAALLTVLLTSLTAVLAVSSGPALAGTGRLHDPAGDATSGPQGPGLDITAARFDNGVRRLVVEVAFTDLHRGDLVVSVAPRGGDGLRLVSYFRGQRPARSFVLPGSFEDAGRSRVPCDGLRVRWDRAAATARLSMPAGCLAHAEYGDLRFAVLTEAEGGDSDFAPDHGPAHTRWIPRG